MIVLVLVSRDMDNRKERPVIEPLSNRERGILSLIEDGLSNREISQELFISPETVKWHNKQIFGKLGVGSRTKAVAKAREHGLLEESQDEPVVAKAQPKHNLRVQLTSFVGRERELTEVKGLLQEAHLLTLTGPAGTGKTRLALQAATELLDGFEDGVYIVDLSPISQPELVVSTIARALGLKESAGQSINDTLKKYVASRMLLLLLDNCEQIIEAAPQVEDLLSVAPRLKVLATSREALRIYGEQEYLVPPLGVPQLDRPETLPDLSNFEAVALFVQRARSVKPDFHLTDEDAPAVAEICIRLDGLPLAIELAAARVKLYSPQVLLRQLGRRFTNLWGGSRGLPTWLETLRGAIDWSYELLDQGEKTLFARLSVFQGGRTVESAVAVCSPKLSIDLLEGLESLLNKSLLLREDGPEGEPRFLILETIHEYARERLEESDEAEALRSRHAHYFVELAERAEPELRRAEQSYWFDRLEAEQDNLRTALAWSLGGGDSVIGLRLVGALRDFWYYQGQKAEGLRWADRALEQTENAPRVVRARVLFTAGMLDWASKSDRRAKGHLLESLTIFRELGHRRGTAWSLMWLSAASIGQPDEYEEAISTCEEALALFRKLDDEPGIAQALIILGELSRLHNDLDRAKTAYEECLALCRKTGDRRRESMSLCSLGFVAQRQGKYDEAEALIKDGTELAWELGFSITVALGLAEMAGPLAAKGDPEGAARLLGASEALFGAIGEDLYPSDQPEIDRYTADVRDQLGEEAFEKLLGKGRAMSPSNAISYALGREVG